MHTALSPAGDLPRQGAEAGLTRGSGHQAKHSVFSRVPGSALLASAGLGSACALYHQSLGGAQSVCSQSPPAQAPSVSAAYTLGSLGAARPGGQTCLLIWGPWHWGALGLSVPTLSSHTQQGDHPQRGRHPSRASHTWSCGQDLGIAACTRGAQTARSQLHTCPTQDPSLWLVGLMFPVLPAFSPEGAECSPWATMNPWGRGEGQLLGHS